jgi:hypothetical protein
MEAISSWSEKLTYSKLDVASDSGCEQQSDSESQQLPVSRRTTTITRTAPWVVHLVFLITSISFFLAGERSERATKQNLGPIETHEYGIPTSDLHKSHELTFFDISEGSERKWHREEHG